MHSQSFAELRARLLQSGVARPHIERITLELSDHLEDLRMEEISAGAAADVALKQAETRLGCQNEIADQILAQTEFKTWTYRYPRLARLYLPIAYVLLLPATPVFVGIANPFKVARWSAALMLAGIVTAGLMLGMQLALVLS